MVGAPVFDVYCLNCREATEPPIDRSPERLAAWILSRRPRFIVLQVVGASERGVWPADQALRDHAHLRDGYDRKLEFGGSEDPLHYILYERRRRAAGSL